MFKREDLTGQTFYRLTAIGLSAKTSGRKTYWRCRCDCGKLKHVRADALKKGRSKSCGCLVRQRIGQVKRTHGMSESAEYRL